MSEKTTLGDDTITAGNVALSEKIHASIIPPCSLVSTEVQSPTELVNLNRVSVGDICN